MPGLPSQPVSFSRESIRALLDANVFFHALPEAARAEVERSLLPHTYKLGEVVIEAGTPGAGFYLIYEGKARVVLPADGGKAVTLATLGKGESFGEQALLYNRPAGATVRAAGTLVVLQLPAERFHTLINTYPAFRASLEEQVRRHAEYNFLRQLGIISQLTVDEAQRLAASVETIRLAEGAYLFHEHEEGDAAFVVREGKVRIVKESAGDALLAVLSPGTLIGEMSILFSQSRSAAAVAATPVVLYRITREAFSRVISSDKAQALLVEQSTNRLLQQRAFIEQEDAEAPVPAASAEAAPGPLLQVGTERLGRGLRARRYPVARTTHPELNGVACLAAVDRFYHQTHDWQEHARRQLGSGTPDDLLAVSRRAERAEYMTRLVTIKPAQLDLVRCPAVAEHADGRISVLYTVTPDRVVLLDPLQGLQTVDRPAFVAGWSGRVLSISYVPNFAHLGTEVKGWLRRILPMARPYTSLILWILLVTAVLQLLGLMIPLFTKIIIDKVLVHGDRSLLYVMLLGMLFVTAFQMAGSSLNMILQAYASRQVGATTLLRFFDHVLSLPHRISSQWRSADFLTRFQENEKFLTKISQTGFKVIVDSLSATLYLVVLLGQSPKLTGVALIFIGGYAVLMLYASPRLRRNDRVVFQRQQEVQSYLIEGVGGVETIKALARETFFLNRGVQLVREAMQAEFVGARLGFNISLVSGLLSQGSTVAVLGYGAVLVLKGEMTAGELVAFTAVLGLLTAPLQSLINTWDELEEVRISFERISDVLRLPVEPRDADVVLPPIQGAVRLENLSFRYADDGENILSNLNLEVLPGQKVALVGRSGSGKSTLAKLLIKLLEPTEGRILVDNVDLRTVDAASFRRQVGVIEQHPYLFSGTIRDNIARVTPHAPLEQVVAAAALAGAHDFVDHLPLRYDTPVGERGLSLSGGQRQRLVIARALLNNPRMLVMDEATAALDTESEHAIQRNIDEMMAGRTVFSIAHRLSTIRNADLIVVLDEGRIVEQGSHDALIERRGLYYYLHQQALEPVAATA